MTTVNMRQAATVVMSVLNNNPPYEQQLRRVQHTAGGAISQSDLAPVDSSHITTVVMSALSESAGGGLVMPGLGRSVTQDAQTTATEGNVTTVDMSLPDGNAADGASQPSNQELWLIEKGDPCATEESSIGTPLPRRF